MHALENYSSSVMLIIADKYDNVAKFSNKVRVIMMSDRSKMYISTQERKVSNMEIDIVMFVIMGSVKLTIPPD